MSYPQLLQRSSVPASYRRQEILTASPGQLVLKLYDYVIIACKKKDEEGASNALIELIDSLNFDYEEPAVGLLRLYTYILGKVRSNEYSEALDMLEDLRDAWAEALSPISVFSIQ